MADRIVLMDDGRIRQIGAPMALYRDPDDLMVAGFLGAPSMNMIAGQITDGVFAAGGVHVPADVGGYDGPATMGVRPEGLSLTPVPGGPELAARVSHVEQLGAETILEAAVEHPALPPLRLRMAGGLARPMDGSTVTIHIMPSAALYFDENGQRLRPPS